MLNYKLFTVFAVILTATIFYDNAFALESKCNNTSHVMVERPNGDNACVTENTADRLVDRLGWIIIESEPPGELAVSELNVYHTDDDYNFHAVTPEDLSTTNYGIPIPIEDRTAFAEKFATALGETITGIDKHGYYLTEHGRINPNVQSFTGYYDELTDSEKQKLSSTFMDKMGFDYTSDELSMRDISAFTFAHNYVKDYSFVHFGFSDFYGEMKMFVSFSGWYNDPTSVEFLVNEDKAIEEGIIFTKQVAHPQLLLEYEDHAAGEGLEKCNLVINDNITPKKLVISDIPYYQFASAYCKQWGSLDGPSNITISVNGLDIEDISWRLGA